MSWLRHVLQSFTQLTAVKGDSQAELGDGEGRPGAADLQTMPSVTFDPSTVSKNVKADLRRTIELLDDLEQKHIQRIYEAALRSISVGRDLHMLYTALMQIEGMPKGRAAEIALSLNNKATALINRERQASLGITHAIWMYPNAPCMRDPKHPTAADVQQDSTHRAANGKKYEIAKGLFVDGKWTRPGVEEGCKCTPRPVLPWVERKNLKDPLG